ncbi:hypothetical protein [Capsulimonas corticalis]|nr:hypothetical protein [Capsulimonas corticalis]
MQNTDLAERITAFLSGITPPTDTPEGRAWLREGKELSAIAPEVFLEALKVGAVGAQTNAQLALRANDYEVWDFGEPSHSLYSIKTPSGEAYTIGPEQHKTFWPVIAPSSMRL